MLHALRRFAIPMLFDADESRVRVDAMPHPANWFFWALLSAVFAALTAVFAKIGIREVDSDLATLIRTAVIIVLLSAFVSLTGSGATRSRYLRKPGLSSFYLLWRPGLPGSAIFVRCKSVRQPRSRQLISLV